MSTKAFGEARPQVGRRPRPVRIGLDQDASAMLDNVLREVAARGRTVVMTSHDLARTADLASRFDILSRGVIAGSVKRSEIDPNELLAYYRKTINQPAGRN